MKKILIAALMLAVCLAFAGCGGTEEAAEPETTEAAAEEATDVDTNVSGPEYTEFSKVNECTSDDGFGMEVYSVALTPDGEVIMQTQGDLAEEVGWETPVAEDVKDIYVERFGNGGFYEILMIKNDGTVSAVNSDKLMNDKKIEVMDKLGGYQDVTGIESVEDPDAYLVNAVMSNGDKFPLDPYLK